MTHSPKANSPHQMQMDKYLPFIGLDYEPPNGCFKLVEQVFAKVYGIDLGKPDAGLENSESKDRTARIQQKLRELTVEVTSPKEGDVVIIRSRPWHIAVVLGEDLMLHAYSNGTSCVESYEDWRWKNRIEGFYRYVGNRTGK